MWKKPISRLKVVIPLLCTGLQDPFWIKISNSLFTLGWRYLAANPGGPHHFPSKGPEMEQLKSLRSAVKIGKNWGQKFCLHGRYICMNQLQWDLVFREHRERPIIVPTSVWGVLEGSTGEKIRSFFVCSIVNYVAEFLTQWSFLWQMLIPLQLKLPFV